MKNEILVYKYTIELIKDLIKGERYIDTTRISKLIHNLEKVIKEYEELNKKNKIENSNKEI